MARYLGRCLKCIGLLAVRIGQLFGCDRERRSAGGDTPTATPPLPLSLSQNEVLSDAT